MTLTVQFSTMMAMAIMGLWIGVSVDTYGRLFYRGPRRRWNLTQITADLVFWLLQGLLVFLVLLYVNHGSVRIYIFLALLCGYAAYRGLFQSVYRKMLESVIRAVRFTGRIVKKFLLFFLLRPFLGLLKVVLFLGKIILKVLFKILYFAWMGLWFPLKGLAGLVLPASVKQSLKEIPPAIKKQAGFLEKVKNLNSKLKTWFGKKKK